MITTIDLIIHTGCLLP